MTSYAAQSTELGPKSASGFTIHSDLLLRFRGCAQRGMKYLYCPPSWQQKNISIKLTNSQGEGDFMLREDPKI